MPANLTPEYLSAEQAFKAAKGADEKLRCLERMLSTLPKHKGTEKMQADIRRRIARTREAIETKSGKKGFAVRVEREGAAQVALVGAPNAGKSALVEATTNAQVAIGDHPFSTHSPVPGMFPFQDVRFQLVDLPPISRGHSEHWIFDIIRGVDAALWVVDASNADFEATVQETRAILAERRIDLSPPDDVEERRHDGACVLPAVVVASKVDEEAARGILPLLRERFAAYPVMELSALGDRDFSSLGRALFDANRIIRVYSKAPGKEADRSAPFIMHKGDTVIDFARTVHKDFADNLRYARLWGHGKFDGQRVQRDERLTDGDLLELHL
jgi:ribosome-interacting GTPase 1